MIVGFEVVAATARTAGWVEDVRDEVWSYEDQGVGEATVYEDDGGWRYDAFNYDTLPARSEGLAPSLEEAKRRAEEGVHHGQMTLASKAAKPKGLRASEDQPSQVPMRPQQAIRTSPSTDQKKVRRQMTRKAATSDWGWPLVEDEVHGHLDAQCPNCGSKNYSSTGNTVTCDGCGQTSTRTTKESTVTARREADLLQAMAKASLEEQREIATELAQMRAGRTASLQAERDTDLAAGVVRAHLTPIRTHALNTTATDWLGEVPTATDADVSLAMKTEASLWYGRTSAEVKADAEEFAIQAEGMGHRVASRFGEQRDAAAQAFLDHIAHLRRVAGEGQSGNGESTITDYDTQADQDPLFAEDWPDAEAEGVHPAMPGAGGQASAAKSAGWREDVEIDNELRRERAPFGEMQPLVDYQETRGDDLSGPDADTIRGMDNEEFERWMDRESKRRAAAKTASEGGSTCATCGDAIAKDPSGEEPSTWHHDNGEKHDHEATPSGESKEGTRKVASEYGGGSPKEGDTAKCHKDGKSIEFFDGQWMHLNSDPAESHNDVYPPNKDERNEKNSGLQTQAGHEVSMATIPDCDVCRVEEGVSKPAKYDSALPGLGGSWGYVCERHFSMYGPGSTGTGMAQRLVQAARKVVADADREVKADDPSQAESGLPTVEERGEEMPEEQTWPETKGFVSGASKTDPTLAPTAISRAAAFRATVQANLGR